MEVFEMNLSTSDKICLASAASIMVAALSIRKQSKQNFATAQAISRNVHASTQRLSQIQAGVQCANRALLQGNQMMRQLLTIKVDKLC